MPANFNDKRRCALALAQDDETPGGKMTREILTGFYGFEVCSSDSKGGRLWLLAFLQTSDA